MSIRITILNDDPGHVTASVRIDESDCPIDADGEPDHGNADWPSDDEITNEVSRLLGRPVSVRFLDVGDTLLEGIYREIRVAP